jgi:hypothetical protein
MPISVGCHVPVFARPFTRKDLRATGVVEELRGVVARVGGRDYYSALVRLDNGEIVECDIANEPDDDSGTAA